jgi:hypothetical protein
MNRGLAVLGGVLKDFNRRKMSFRSRESNLDYWVVGA